MTTKYQELQPGDKLMADKELGCEEKWLPSREVLKELGISSCKLMHRREGGGLRFKKQGNAFLYAAADVKHSQAKGREALKPSAGTARARESAVSRGHAKDENSFLSGKNSRKAA